MPGAEHTIGGGMEFGGQSSWVGMSSGPTEPTAASTETEEQFFAGASSEVAVQAAAAAKGGDLDGDGTVGADAAKAQEPGSSHQEEGVLGAAPEDEAEKDSARRAINDAPGAERARGGGMKFGGQSSVVGASGSPTELQAAFTTTAEQVLVGASSVVAIQAAVEDKSSDADGGGTAGAYVINA